MGFLGFGVCFCLYSSRDFAIPTCCVELLLQYCGNVKYCMLPERNMQELTCAHQNIPFSCLQAGEREIRIYYSAPNIH